MLKLPPALARRCYDSSFKILLQTSANGRKLKQMTLSVWNCYHLSKMHFPNVIDIWPWCYWNKAKNRSNRFAHFSFEMNSSQMLGTTSHWMYGNWIQIRYFLFLMIIIFLDCNHYFWIHQTSFNSRESL